jgi:WD40 repeat protein
VIAIAFSPDGKTIASTAAWENIRRWDVATGRERQPSEGHRGIIDLLRFSPDGKTLISIGRDQRLLGWDVAARTPRRQFSWTGKNFLRTIALSPDGDTLAVGDGMPDFEVRLWNVRTGKPGRLLGKHEKRLWAIAFSPDGRLVASGGEDHVIHIWDVRDGKEIQQIKGIANTVSCLCFSPDSKSLACGTETRGGKASNEPTVHLWNVANGKERLRFDNYAPFDGALAFSPDGKVLASSSGAWDESKVHLWDAKTGKELRRHEGHRETVATIAFSPDGKLIASASGSIGTQDNSVHVWEAATGRLIRRFEGHHSGVISLDFSPDGLTVASGAGDSTILLWDITGRRADGRWHGKPLTPRELDACWLALADEDAAKAYDAVWMLSASAEQAVPFLAKHLQPVPRPDAKVVARLIADLDSDNFNVRQRAMKELGKFGDAIAPALRRALDGKPALEIRRRVQQLLNQSRDWTPERLREHRAIQALEHIGTPAGRQLLETLAQGAPEARLTDEAKAALRRLAR